MKNPSSLAGLTIAGMSLIGVVGVIGWQFVKPAWSEIVNPYLKVFAKPTSSEAEVVKVLDGATIVVDRHGEEEKTKLACIRAPKLSEPLGQKSRDSLRSLIKRYGPKVQVDVVDTDQDGINSAEVFINLFTDYEKTLQTEQVLTGMAVIHPQEYDKCLNQPTLVVFEREAKEKQLGLWKTTRD